MPIRSDENPALGVNGEGSRELDSPENEAATSLSMDKCHPVSPGAYKMAPSCHPALGVYKVAVAAVLSDAPAGDPRHQPAAGRRPDCGAGRGARVGGGVVPGAAETRGRLRSLPQELPAGYPRGGGAGRGV